jgi:hypothetical protein
MGRPLLGHSVKAVSGQHSRPSHNTAFASSCHTNILIVQKCATSVILWIGCVGKICHPKIFLQVVVVQKSSLLGRGMPSLGAVRDINAIPSSQSAATIFGQTWFCRPDVGDCVADIYAQVFLLSGMSLSMQQQSKLANHSQQRTVCSINPSEEGSLDPWNQVWSC